jgi:FkbM family methyltransferase
MSSVSDILTRSRRIAKQIVGKDLWTSPEIKIPCIRLGSDYGGWTVATAAGLGPGSNVYSVGVGEDISFDLALINAFGCSIAAFDPTPRSIAWASAQKVPDELHFYPWGLGGSDGTMSFSPPRDPRHASYSAVSNSGSSIQCEVYRLSTIMTKLRHVQLDLVKMDIEGAEYDVIEDMQGTKVRPRQLLVEFHHGLYGIGIQKTKSAISQLKSLGYKCFSISPTGREYSFVSQSQRDIAILKRGSGNGSVGTARTVAIYPSCTKRPLLLFENVGCRPRSELLEGGISMIVQIPTHQGAQCGVLDNEREALIAGMRSNQ